jgi:hypothetical protein
MDVPTSSLLSRHRAWFIVGARLVLVVLLVVSVVELLASSTYRVPGGQITLDARPAWPGGQLVLPLGPAGRVEMHTHQAPLDLVVHFELAGGETLADIGTLSQRLPAARASAERAFRKQYLVVHRQHEQW